MIFHFPSYPNHFIILFARSSLESNTTEAESQQCSVAHKPAHHVCVHAVHGTPCIIHDDLGTSIAGLGSSDFQNRLAVPHSSHLTPLSHSSASAVKWKMVSEKIRIKLLKHLDTFKRIAEHRSTQD